MNKTQFVTRYMQAYNSGLSYAEFGKSMNKSTAAVYQTARNYRIAGVKLPKLTARPENHRVNVDYLNQLIAKLAKK